MKLAILYGRGDLPDEVYRLATSHHPTDAAHYDLAGPFAIVRHQLHGERLDPLKFESILNTFRSNAVDTVLFAGSFRVSDRFRAMLTQFVLPVGFAADAMCRRAYEQASASLYPGARFTAAATATLRAQNFGLPYVGELFPTVVAPEGVTGAVSPSEEYVASLPKLLPLVVSRLQETAGIYRPAQSAIENLGSIPTVETAGTDRLIRTAARIEGERYPVLLKLLPPHFDCIIDQPVIGLTTIEECKKADIRGIVIIAARTVIIDKAMTIEAANRSGIFIYALPPAWLVDADPRYADLLHL